MPWCPICKTEYREGIETCADCKCDLVETLEGIKDMKLLATIDGEELAVRLKDYLGYSGFEAELETNEDGTIGVLVEEKDYKKAKVSFGAFYSVEAKKDLENRLAEAAALAEEAAEAEEAEEASDEELSDEELRKKALEEIVYNNSGVYVKKSDVSKEMLSTAVTFIVFGVALMIFMLLNAFEVITLFANIPALVILGALAVGCLIVGLNAIGRAKRAGAQSVEEDKLTAMIDEWMETTFTEEFMQNADDPALSEELNYLRRSEAMKKALVEKYGELDDSYIDSVIEDFYNSHFEA